MSEERLVNEIVSENWSHIILHEIEKMKTYPYISDSLGPYEMRLKDARFVKPPTLHDISLKPQPFLGAPIEFECTIDYAGRPDVMLVFKPNNKSSIHGAVGKLPNLGGFLNNVVEKTTAVLDKAVGAILPKVELHVHTLIVKARVAITIRMRSKELEYYFVTPPEISVSWDMDKLKLLASPIKKKAAEQVLHVSLGHIDETNPQLVKWGKNAD
jgi:hypothetical protein